MADNLIFPIGFDLEKAVNEAGQQWDKKYAKKLEDYINKRPIKVELDFENLTDVKTRLAQLKIEPITPATKAAIKELARELQVLAKALEQVQKYSKNPTKGAVDASRVALNEEKVKAQAALAAQRATRAEANLAQARLRDARAANVGVSATREANKAYHEQSGYLQRLMQRMATYWSVRQVGQFLTNIREVTAQFELQRVSLGAIIQDQAKANMLFSEIKSFALKSPVSILDLTKYTKQLAAYKVGWNGVTTDVKELFDWTKRLTDVSVGLGVSMDRVVLAFGQVRATGYLRASEVRQFTEMGVPIVEELAAKLEKLNGEAVTAAEVMDMISKRGISFELVKEVFDDMTSAGGMFYNMQEKQGNTLFGLWAKLGDAASVMYDEIGRSGVVNQVMKSLIEGITSLMKHWDSFASIATVFGSLFLANTAALKIFNAAVFRYTTAGKAAIATSRAKVVAAHAEVRATRTAGNMAQWAAIRDHAVAVAKYNAATATNVFAASLYKLKAAFLSNPFGWVIGIVGTLVSLLWDASDSLGELNGELSEINEKYTLKGLNDADNFKHLADGAMKAANGSKEQKDKLAELDRTYGEIVGSENLQIQKLSEMTDGYDSLIQTIKEYNTQMKYSEREGAIKEFYGGKKKEAFGDFEDELSTIGTGEDEVGHEVGASIAINIQDALLEELEKNGKATANTANKLLEKQLTNVFISRGKSEEEAKLWAISIIGRLSSETEEYVKWLNAENNALKENDKLREEESGNLGAVIADIKKAKKELEGARYLKSDGKTPVDEDTMLYQQMVKNATMKKAADLIRNNDEFKKALGDKAKELEPEWLHLVDSVSPNDLMDITTVNFDAILKIIGDKSPNLTRRIKKIQEEWGNVAPTDATVLQINQKLVDLSKSFDPTLSKMKQFLWDGSGEVDEYLKRLKEQQEKLRKQLKAKQNTLLQMSVLSKWWNKLQGKDIEAEVKQLQNEIKALDTFVPFVTAYTVPEKGKGGRKSDPRLQNLKEEISLYEKLYQEYKQYEKAVGSSKAAEYMEREAKATIDALAEKYGIGLPKNVTDLTSALEILYKKMQALPSKVFKNLDKELKEFRWKIEKVDIDESQKNIEAELKRLSDRISRTKTAKEFYEKILGMTGDYDLAAKVSLSIYGDTGYDLQKQLAEQIRTYFDNENIKVEIPVDVITADNRINYKRLGEFAEQMKEKLGEEPYKAIKKIAEEGQKDLAKTYEGYLKDLEKAKTYADKRVELARTTAAKIRAIERNPQLSKEQKTELKRGYQEREDREAAKLEYEAFKDTPLYVQMFEDLEQASTSTLEMMKSRLEALSRVWGTALDPTQLKEIQSRMNEIDTQLRTRNPFKTLKESYQQYRDAVKSVSLPGAVENAGAAAKELYNRSKTYGADSAQARAAEKELKAREKIVEIARQITAENKKGQKALDAAAQKANDNLMIKRGELEIASAEEQALRDKSTYKDPNQDPAVIAAHERVETAKEEVNLAERVAEITTNNAKSAKTLKENFVSAAGQAVQFMQIGGDLAHAVADTMEALGGDEDDVQFWNDIGTAIDDLTAGFQGITDVIQSAMSGNVMGVISSAVGIIPNMVKGFVGLFSAGKVRRANKEIKRQQELLEQLEYTYGRLEKAADKVFGADYINNFKQQQKNLEAQARAYQAMANAERSKGKKADQAKIQDYLNSYRDTMDQIADMQGQIAAQMLGTDLTSAARDFAKAWLDAYKEFGNTADAMSEKFHEMIENMVVEGALGRVMEKALQPMFEMIDTMGEQDFYDKNFWKRVTDLAAAGAKNADMGAQTMMRYLEQAGIQLTGTAEGLSGISRDIASASEESINGLAAGVSTQNYYISQQLEEVRRIRAIIEAGLGTATLPAAGSTMDYMALHTEAMGHLSAINQHTAETVAECRQIASQCREEVTLLKKVIIPKGGAALYGVKVWM